MSISHVGAATGTTTCTVPAHNIGDLIVIFAYRSGSTTAPSLGAGYVSVLTKAGTTCSARIGFKIATATNDASGTWTNASNLTCVVYTSSNRTSGGSLYVGGSASNSSINTTVNYPALTLTHTDNTSWAAGFAGTSVATAALSTHAPTGMTFITNSNVTATTEVCAFDTNGTVSSWSSQNTTVSASGNSVSATLEIIENLPGAGIPNNIVQSVSTAANAVISTAAGNNFRIPLPNATLSGNGLVLAVSYPTANTPSISDDGGNTWPASGAAGTVTADAGDQVLQMFRLASAATGTKVITVNFGSTVVQPVKIWIWEVFNITGTVNGTVEAAGVNSLGIVSPGSFTPTNNNANGGNLIFAVACIANGTSSTNPNLIQPESNYTLTDGDIFWTGTQGNPSASQVFLQATSAATTPRFYFQASGTQTYNVVAMALSVGTQGTQHGTGIHIDGIRYFSAAGNTASMRMQVPSSGNLAVVTGFMSSATSTNPTWTAITDSDGTSWTRIDPSPASTPCFYFNPNQTPKSYRTATITLGNGTGNPVQVVYYDISGAATSPLDTSAGQAFPTLNGSNQASASNIITASTQNGLVLGFLQLGLGPSTTLASPSGGFADLPTYDTATGTGSIAATTLTISATTWGAFSASNNLIAGPNITVGTSIVSGTGPFTINPSQTAASGAVTQKQFDSDTMSFGNFAGHYYNGTDTSAETWTINITNQGTATGGNFTVAAFKAAPTAAAGPQLNYDFPNPIPVTWYQHWQYSFMPPAGPSFLIRNSDWPNPPPISWYRDWYQDPLPLRAIVPIPFFNRDWPNFYYQYTPNIEATLETGNAQPPLLIIPPPIIIPQPIVYNIERLLVNKYLAYREYSYSSLKLLTNQPASVFNNYDYPNPPRPVWYQHWQSFFQDIQFQPASVFNNYDYPNPQPVYWYRDYSQNLQQTTLKPTFQSPFNQFYWPVPAGNPRPDEFYSFNNIEVISKQPASVFNNSDWPNPQPIKWYQNHTFFEPQITQQPASAFNNYDWQLPYPVEWYESWLQALVTYAPIFTPFNQTDWPNPKGFPPIDQFWSNNLVELVSQANPVPFSQSDWPNPRTNQPIDQSFWQSLALILPPPPPPVEILSSGHQWTEQDVLRAWMKAIGKIGRSVRYAPKV